MRMEGEVVTSLVINLIRSGKHRKQAHQICGKPDGKFSCWTDIYITHHPLQFYVLVIRVLFEKPLSVFLSESYFFSSISPFAGLGFHDESLRAASRPQEVGYSLLILFRFDLCTSI